MHEERHEPPTFAAWLWIAWIVCGLTLAAASAFAQDEKPKPAKQKPKPAAAASEEKAAPAVESPCGPRGTVAAG